MRIRMTIILTILAQFIAIKQNGYWGLGGNIFILPLCYLIFWQLPEVFKEIWKDFKEMDWYE